MEESLRDCGYDDIYQSCCEYRMHATVLRDIERSEGEHLENYPRRRERSCSVYPADWKNPNLGEMRQGRDVMFTAFRLFRGLHK